MENWLPKSNDTGNTPTTDDAKVEVKTTANRVIANVFAFCTSV